MTENPLTKFYRVPKLYIKLPTNGVFYAKDAIQTAINGEVAIYALSAVDELLMRTPDALFNGESLLSIIRNCVPGVQDPKILVEPDINSILLAIRIASNGPMMSMDSTCPNCSHENSFELNLQNILDTQSYLDDTNELEFDEQLVIRLRPYNFEQRHLQIINEIQETQTIQQLQSNNSADVERVAEVAQLVNKMAKRTFDIVAKSITEIEIKTTGETVTDPQHISEFMQGISKFQSDLIINKIKDLNSIGINKEADLVCSSCGHQWTQPVDYDPTSFFE